MDYKWEGWNKPVTIATLAALEMRLPKEYVNLFKPGAFRFDDGTTQGWIIDQLYDQNFNKLTCYTDQNNFTYDFKLCNSQNLALGASGCPVIVLAGSNVTILQFYLLSPDLRNNQDWKNINGFSLDLQRNYYSSCGDLGDYLFQMSITVIDKTTKATRYFGECDAQTGEFIFHKTTAQQPYHFEWKADAFKDPNLELWQLRLRFIQPHYSGLGAGECLPKGSWLVGNIKQE